MQQGICANTGAVCLYMFECSNISKITELAGIAFTTDKFLGYTGMQLQMSVARTRLLLHFCANKKDSQMNIWAFTCKRTELHVSGRLGANLTLPARTPPASRIRIPGKVKHNSIYKLAKLLCWLILDSLVKQVLESICPASQSISTSYSSAPGFNAMSPVQDAPPSKLTESNCNFVVMMFRDICVVVRRVM